MKYEIDGQTLEIRTQINLDVWTENYLNHLSLLRTF